jgi:HSP20 family protein
MRSRLHGVVLPAEAAEFADELREIFAELGRASSGAIAVTGECSPAVDIYETDETVEMLMDLAGVDRSGVRIIIKGHSVLIAGEKLPRRTRGESTFHLVERGFGRFARTARVGMACDTARAKAVLKNGELRLTIPKLQERRGRTIKVPVE